MNNDAERRRLLEALDRFRASLPDYDEDEVMADIEEAVKAVRREWYAAQNPPKPADEETG
jgi:hypothetical protein